MILMLCYMDMMVSGAGNIIMTSGNPGGRSLYYDFESGHCPRCVKHWKVEQQIMYTTKNEKRTYPICPQCKIKQPLRKKPRHKKFYSVKHPSKRIEGGDA